MAKSRCRGQIIEKGKGKWLVRIYRGRDVRGRNVYFSKVVAGNKSDAHKFLTAKQREKDTGIFIDSARQTMKEHLESWQEIIKTRVSEQTYDSYSIQIRVHIQPIIGHKKLSEVRINDIQRVYSKMETKGLSPRTIRYTHTILSMAMKKAIELDYIVKNPCDFVELPKQVQRERRAFSAAQARQFVETAAGVENGLILEFALITGMRPEEYLVLRWSDVDIVKCLVRVERALIWNRKGGGFRFDEPKTAKSRRSLPIPRKLVEKLKAHRRHQLEERMKVGFAYQNLDLVFVTRIGTPISARNLAQREFAKILKKIGLVDQGFVLYSLRHTCATLLMASGENPKVVAERLGHTSVKLTLDTYSHVMPDMQEAASARLSKMVYG